jgi:hypothetical protein
MLESIGLLKKGQLFVEQACAFHLQVLLVSKPDALLDHLGALHICLSI